MIENVGDAHTRVGENRVPPPIMGMGNRAERNVVLGPPGTGKTTTLLKRFEGELERGLRPAQIGFVTFTRAARAEALDRISKKFGIRKESLPWVATIHSSCYRLLGLKKTSVMQPKDWREFGELYHYNLSEERRRSDIENPLEESGPPAKTEDDHLAKVVDYAALRCVTIEQAAAGYKERVDVEQAAIFAERIAAFKAERKLFDFNDMLIAVLGQRIALPIKTLFVDEAQDLAPVQIAVIEQWADAASTVFIAGDDDQAIFGFQGAEPRWIIEQSKSADHCDVLAKSWRIPSSIHEVALSIIESNRDRVQKIYTPRDEEGSVVVTDNAGAFAAVPKEGSVFVLARNRRLLAAWRERLIAEAEPYEGSPLDRPTVRASLDASREMTEMGSISKAGLLAWLALIPSGPYAPRGVKAMAKRLDDDERLSWSKLIDEPWQLSDVVDLAMDDPVGLLRKLKPHESSYIRRVIAKYGTNNPAARWSLRTIHGAKGAEADTVVVLSDMMGASYRELQGREGEAGIEAEYRCAYVAVTRARNRLIIVRPSTWKHFDYARHVR